MKVPPSYVLTAFIVGIAVGAGDVYYMYAQTDSIDAPDTGTEISILKQVPAGAPSGTDDDSAETVYANERYGFSLRYPRELVYKEFDDAGGIQTIVFQDPGDAKTGFQLYITPYADSTITGERILYDASGPISDLKEEYIKKDLLVATFSSEAPFLGKTREIWWLHGGYLFELTTYAERDAWVRDIVKTIEFK